MNKQDIVVHIKDEEMLSEARKILESAGENITDAYGLWLCVDDDSYNYLSFMPSKNLWQIQTMGDETEITLTQLKELLS